MNVKPINLFKISSLILLLSCLSLACGTSQKATAEDIDKLEQLVMNKYFEFDLQFAKPMATNSLNQLDRAGLFRLGDNASQINLQGFAAVFKFEGDTVTADLPFFGERQFGGGYDSNTGIDFEGTPKNLKIKKDEKKDAFRIDFDIKENSESYQVSVTIYSNLNGHININSAQRFPMRYEGKVKAIELPEEKE